MLDVLFSYDRIIHLMLENLQSTQVHHIHKVIVLQLPNLLLLVLQLLAAAAVVVVVVVDDDDDVDVEDDVEDVLLMDHFLVK